MANPKKKVKDHKEEPGASSTPTPAEQAASQPAAQAAGEVMIFPTDRWIYHETEEPRILKAEQPLSTGWQLTPAFPGFTWGYLESAEWGKQGKFAWQRIPRQQK